MIQALFVLLLSITFAVSPVFVTSFQGFDPALYPIPQVDPPVQPAGYAFAIWGLIYAWLILHGAWGLWKRADDPAWARVRAPLIGSLAIGTFWLWIAERSPIWATVTIFAMLGLAVRAVLASDRRRDRWLLRAPLAIYAGWLSAAACASLGLLGAGWGVALSQVGWAYAMILLATAIAAAVQVRLARTPDYGLTVAWALVAIVVQNLGRHPGVMLAAALATAVILVLAARSVSRRA